MPDNKLDKTELDLSIFHCQVLKQYNSRTGGRPWFVSLWLCALALWILLAAPVSAQMPPAPGTPNFWDLQRRVEKPNTAFLRMIRFVTDDDYPPFGVTLPGGALTGFNVELARAICKELAITCTVQARRFDTIADAIETGKADAAIASMAINAKARERLLFTHPYYRTPARFVVQKNTGPGTITPTTLTGKTVGVVGNTAHSAFLARFFPNVTQKPFATKTALLQALKDKHINLLFGDGVTLAIWLNSAESGDCCGFHGGPYTESFYFGEGVGIAVNKKNAELKQVLDFALFRLAENGVYSELYLKYFPIGFY
ncbi:MAG: transporter substrate-binding domain-containing protein [Beijerinckiaceae bacterium]|jgi:polar amino acid transport system substrate-binding protein|nr:transporter substrate-binding domain-containing protein [Beijerinckiaceae bacterium]